MDRPEDRWMGHGSREAFVQYIAKAIVKRTRNITVSEGFRQLSARCIEPPPLVYIIESDILPEGGQRNGESADHLFLRRILDRRQLSARKIALGTIRVNYTKADPLIEHNDMPRPDAHEEDVRRVYQILAARVRMAEQNTSVAILNLEHFVGMYGDKIDVVWLPTPYVTPKPGSVDDIVYTPDKFPHRPKKPITR